MSDTYEWRNNLACVATYNILEGGKFLDQFEDVDTPFAKAGTLKLNKLRYFPRTTTNPVLLEMAATTLARSFLVHLGKTFTNRKQDRSKASQDIVDALSAIFADGSKTLCDVAETVDAMFQFPDEA